MNFKPYPEIPYMTPGIIKMIRDHGFDKDSWYVSGKVDGSNFQVAIDVDDTMHFGGRNHELDRYDNYNNWRHAAEKQHINEKVRRLKDILDDYELWDIVKEGPYVLVVYFELVGGVYKHPDVKPVEDAVKIQGRVQYHPDNVFIALDAFWYQPSTKDHGWIAPSTFDDACDKANIPHRQLLAHLPFDEAIKYPNAFEDHTGPVLFGLPQIPDNIAEGVVLFPWTPRQFHNGARVIMKNKNHLFEERVVKTNKVKKPEEPLNERETEMYNNYMSYITESRFMSVLSKMDVTSVTEKSFGIMLQSFMEDADKDFSKEYGEQVHSLETQYSVTDFNFMKVLKAVKKEASALIRPKFIELIRDQTHD